MHIGINDLLDIIILNNKDKGIGDNVFLLDELVMVGLDEIMRCDRHDSDCIY